MASPTLPTLRWGIIATGAISTAFVKDLILTRPDAKAHHLITVIGSSSREKGDAFVKEHLPNITPSPTVYEGYAGVCTDSNVDIVYIGTPNSFHKQNCIDAINARKHVLCEKAFALNAGEAREVFDLAEKEGVFIMEGMWTRFFPLTLRLQHLIHGEKVIGDVLRVFADFSRNHELEGKGMESRLKNPALGAGSLLNLGVYSLTWALLVLDAKSGQEAEQVNVKGVQTLRDGNRCSKLSPLILSLNRPNRNMHLFLALHQPRQIILPD
jgi:predicted dehydrogenase